MLYRSLSLLCFVAACQDDISTRFPPGLEPFDDGDAPLDLDDTPTEELRTASSDDDFVRAYGRGFVLAPPTAVWAAANDPEVLVAVCKTSSHQITPATEPEYALSFLVHYFVDDIVNVEWDDQWRGDLVAGTLEQPAHFMIKHQKTQGSDFITLSEGTIEIVATADPAVTELRFVEHLEAVSATEADVLAGMQHTFDALVAVSHGGTIPRCQ